MRILMLNPPFWGKFSRSSRSPGISKGGCVYYPIWMGYATGCLEQAGHKVKLVDAPAVPITLEESLRISKEFDPQLIVVDSVTASINNDVKVVEELRKQHHDVYIVMVGTHPSAMPVQTLKMSQADAVTIEEYDFTLRELAELLEKKKDISQVKGLAVRIKNSDGTEQIRINEKRAQITGEELDAFPFVSEVYSRQLNIKDYFYPSVLYPEITIITGRGCPFKCTFCVLPQVMNGHLYRARSAENTVAELKWIADNLPEVKDIMIEDDTFTVDRLRLNKISDLIVESGLKTTFTVNSRADMDANSLKKLKAAGCRLMCVGFESADQGVLDNIKKQTRIDKIKRFVVDSKQAGLLIHGCFMMGNK
ncbi:MAG: radical SAM protein, partial [Nitrosarchaeum sp.]|nr:radical SAM protein [Nitrosarchaeum sp.]